MRSSAWQWLKTFAVASVLLSCTAMAVPTGMLAAQQQPQQLRADSIAPGVWVIAGHPDGTLLLAASDSGALLVDGQTSARVLTADSALRAVTPAPVKLVVSTHYHDDHIGGNPHWHAAGATIIGHANMVVEARRDTFIPALEWDRRAAQPSALPSREFTDSVVLAMGTLTATVFHLPAAHTSGDALVRLRGPGVDVLHTGDIVELGAPPFIDWWAGGTLDGMIAAVEHIIATTDAHTIIVPGHGRICNREDVVKYHALLIAARGRVASEAKAGVPLDVLIARRPLAEFEQSLGGPRRADRFVRGIYVGREFMHDSLPGVHTPGSPSPAIAIPQSRDTRWLEGLIGGGIGGGLVGIAIADGFCGLDGAECGGGDYLLGAVLFAAPIAGLGALIGSAFSR